ncbi:CWC16 protein [Leucosporidium creatinivorum]|uniref:Splicing factor YJU2 n=1 Tax=Leucosporidium creatinivorum TaxID=106004 RepID=A0A1Y2G2B6_9BASI|nr:CWC16 protein [Leucosporidium creatinivorum]
MAERKVLNKYFPADFDPSKIPRRKMPKDKQQVIRLMAPFSMRCSTCGEYMYKGKKFNARKETVIGEEYYGIKIFRFYIKCITCSSEITFKTDPKNTDYAVEHGAYRNFEPWRDASDTKDNEDKLDQLEAQEAEENDPMAALESKAVDSKREMDILDALQELKSRNARHERAGKGDVTDKILDRVSSGVEVGDREVERKLTEYELKRKKEEEEDEEEVRKVFGRAFVGGVPDIELEEGGTTTEEDSEPGTPRDGGDAQPQASGSGSAKPAPSAASVKRKLDAVEPTPASLLSAASRSIVDKSFGGGAAPPPKKKGKGNAALAAKLGIKLKK